MMRVRRHRDVPFHRVRFRPVRVESRLRMSGSSRNLLDEKMSPVAAGAVIRRMEIAMRRDRVRGSSFLLI